MTVTRIGAATLNRVEEVRIPNPISYFTTDQELLAANRYWLYPHFLNDAGVFDLVFQSWILEIGQAVVLIDPCTGNDRPHPVKYFDRLQTPYIERLSKLGYRPQDIDFVVCTHLHHDHCGWNTRLRDGQWTPTFPNARYIINRLEYETLAGRHTSLPVSDLNRGVFERSVSPVVDAGLVDLVSSDHLVTAGVTVRAATGHTLGHQMVHLVSDGRHALFTGDCFHHPIQLADPNVMFAGGEDLEALVRTRRSLVRLSCELDAPLIAAHVPAPYAVRAARVEDEVRFSAGF